MNPAPAMAMVGRKHDALRRVAAPVDPTDLETAQVAMRMRVTLAKCGSGTGMALAAPQVGLGLQIVVTAPGLVVCNLKVEPVGDKVEEGPEGCLSMPGHWFNIERPKKVHVHATQLDGQVLDFDCSGVHARMWTHEYEHLRGVMVHQRGKACRAPEHLRAHN